jgi:hypothetical protein
MCGAIGASTTIAIERLVLLKFRLSVRLSTPKSQIRAAAQGRKISLRERRIF